jgi:hypothetical protein
MNATVTRRTNNETKIKRKNHLANYLARCKWVMKKGGEV